MATSQHRDMHRALADNGIPLQPNRMNYSGTLDNALDSMEKAYSQFDKLEILKIRNARGFVLKSFSYLGILDLYDPGTSMYKELFQIIESTQDVLYATPVSQDESKVLRAYFDIISSRIMKSSQFIYIAAAHCGIYFWMKVEKTSLERNLNRVRNVGARCFISDQDEAFHIHTGEYMIELLSNVPR